MNELVRQIAENAGASLAPGVTSGNALQSFEVLRSGEVAVILADGSRLVMASRRTVSDAVIPAGVLTAEAFLTLMGQLGASVPLGASPIGRRFFARRSVGANGKTGIRFSEAGRDV